MGELFLIVLVFTNRIQGSVWELCVDSAIKVASSLRQTPHEIMLGTN